MSCDRKSGPIAAQGARTTRPGQPSFNRYGVSIAAVFNRHVPITLNEPGTDGLPEAIRVLREWQHDGAPVPLHPGDLGWYCRFGEAATAAAVRTWSRAGQVLAVGLLDGPGLLRLAIAPASQQDEELARQLVADANRPERGILPAGDKYIEVRSGALFRELLADDGWDYDEPWAPLARDLAGPVPDCGLRIEVTSPDQAEVRAAVQRAAFDKSTFTAERWHAMAAGVAYADARCLVGYDGQDTAVAAATAWSAGPGRPGLLEPLGVHRDHRGHGYGTAISLAAAAALRELGSSSATVCTPSANLAAVTTYASAGFQQLPQVRDLHRGA